MKKFLIFDCDGTLVDSEIIAADVFPAVWSTMGLQMTREYFINNFVGTGSDAEIVKATMALLPPDAMEIADRKFDEEIALRLEAVGGIKDLLAWVPFEMSVASNSSLPYVKSALSKTGLADFFCDRVYSAREVGRPKPAPDVFLRAASENGFAPSNCIVIEDSVSGIKAAQNAGMKVIGFMGGLHCNMAVKNRLLAAQADHYCSSAKELRELLQSEYSNNKR